MPQRYYSPSRAAQVRPWEYILAPTNGYIILAQRRDDYLENGLQLIITDALAWPGLVSAPVSPNVVRFKGIKHDENRKRFR